MGRMKYRHAFATIVLTLITPCFCMAYESAYSTNTKREILDPVKSQSGYSPQSPGVNPQYRFKFNPSAVPASHSSKTQKAPSIRKDTQPVVPDIVGLSDIKRNMNPEYRPASHKNTNNVIAIPRVTKPKWPEIVSMVSANNPKIKAKALFCVDRSSNRVILAENISAPLPIASITKLLTAMIVIDDMNLTSKVVVPNDIREVAKHTVGIRPGEVFTVQDLLHGMLIESGNDCAEALASAYPKGGRAGLIATMNKKASELGASSVRIFTPSGLDHKFILGRKDGRELPGKKPNISTAQDVALVADHAFKYPLIAQISSMKKYTMRTLNEKPKDYPLYSNDKLLDKNLPVAGAKTGFTNMAGKCIVALFKNDDKEHLVVVLNTAQHFKAAEKIYRWAASSM